MEESSASSSTGTGRVEAAVEGSAAESSSAMEAAVESSAAESSAAMEAAVESSAAMETAVESSAAMETAVEGSEVVEAAVQGSSAMEAAVEGSSAMEADVEGSSAMEADVEGSEAVEATLEGSAAIEAHVGSAIEGSTALEPAVEGSAAMEAAIDGSVAMEVAIEGSVTMEAAVEGSAAMEAAVEGSATMEAAVEGSATMEGDVEGSAALEAAVDCSAAMEVPIEGSVTMETGVESSAAMEGAVECSALEKNSCAKTGHPQLETTDPVNNPSDSTNDAEASISSPTISQDSTNKVETQSEEVCCLKASESEPSETDLESNNCDKGDNLPGQFPGDHDYELVDGSYYYTDASTEVRYRYDNSGGGWVVATAHGESSSADIDSHDGVHVDEEGRTYYYADELYLCRYPTGHVYYLDAKSEWVLWETKSTPSSSSDENRWHFYKGNDEFYRDCLSNIVYKLNKDLNEWEIFKNNRKRKLKKTDGNDDDDDEEEEFDTESSNDEDDDHNRDEHEHCGAAPPGYKNDPNITFDGRMYTKTNKEDSMAYEWDAKRRAWFPKLDDDFMAKYQMNYGFNPDGTKNENPVKYDDDEEDEEEEAERERQKKKEEEEKKKKDKRPPGWFHTDDAHNTKVYVSKLPEDMTEQQFVDLMQKCGLVLKDAESGDYKVKLYKDSEGNFKGDALCTYIKVESVELALNILDGACAGATSTQRITVERAKFAMKGDYNAALKPKKKRKKVLDKLQKKQEKLFSWHPEPLRGQRGKHENVIVIRNAFDRAEFIEHAENILAHTECLRAQCSSFGVVRKLELFDRHSEGVVKVVYSEVEAADLCIASMHGRLYKKRTLTVKAWDGAENFKVEETEEERVARIKKWNEFLVKDEKSDVVSSGADGSASSEASTA